MSESITKTFNLSKEELAHFNHIAYARDYLEQSNNQFISGLIVGRLGEKPTPDTEIEWRIEDGKLVLDIRERDSLYKPTDSE
jgi:hypothetical protein